jgi:hypothetical protein
MLMPSLFDTTVGPAVKAVMVGVAICMALLVNWVGMGFGWGVATFFAIMLLDLLLLVGYKHTLFGNPKPKVVTWRDIMTGVFSGMNSGILVYAMHAAVARYTPVWASWLLGAILGQLVAHALAALTRFITILSFYALASR